MSCRRGPSGFSRRNRRQLCTVSSRGNCSCSERLTWLPSLCHHIVRKKRVLHERHTVQGLMSFLIWCHYEQRWSVHEISHQYDYSIGSSRTHYFVLEFEETFPTRSLIKTDTFPCSHLTKSTNLSLAECCIQIFLYLVPVSIAILEVLKCV